MHALSVYFAVEYPTCQTSFLIVPPSLPLLFVTLSTLKCRHLHQYAAMVSSTIVYTKAAAGIKILLLKSKQASHTQRPNFFHAELVNISLCPAAPTASFTILLLSDLKKHAHTLQSIAYTITRSVSIISRKG